MSEFTVYDPETGTIRYTGSARDIDAQAEDGLGVIKGRGDARTQRVVGGKLQMIPKRERDRKAKARAMRKLRGRRDRLLHEMGTRLNPVFWATLTQEQRQAWQEYRQALLDLPQTVADPENITWPTPPE